MGAVGIALLALVTGPATEPRPRPALHVVGDEQQRRARRRIVSLLIPVAALSVIVAEAIPLLAQTKIRDSQAAIARGDGADALADALAARSLQSWAASPHLQLALVHEELEQLPPARAAIADAIERDRRDWRLWLVAARLELEAGNVSAARRSLARARALNPRSPLFARARA